MPKTTADLKEALMKSSDLNAYFANEKKNLAVKPLGILLSDLAYEHDISLPALQTDSGISKSYFYDFLNGKKKNPSRELIIAVLIALNCSIDECDQILKYAGVAPLYARDKWDAVIIYARKEGYDLLATDMLLEEQNLPTFKHLHRD